MKKSYPYSKDGPLNAILEQVRGTIKDAIYAGSDTVHVAKVILQIQFGEEKVEPALAVQLARLILEYEMHLNNLDLKKDRSCGE